VKNSKRKQVFYFDDFLGRTALGKVQKDEDYRIVELMEEVASNPNWRFILTTREYILNSARINYEAFANPTIDFRLCIVNIEDYTRPIRARILYNHIYFSGLPDAHKLALLADNAYEGILRHRNYNPRVIEYMTQSSHACSVPATLYATEFVNNLDHPTRIWDHAFRYQISEAARHILLALSSLPDDVLLDDLEIAFREFYRFRQSRFGFSTRSSDWTDGLKEIDGNFISTRTVGRDILVSFHSPSIRDFVEYFLSGSGTEVVDLIRGAHFYEQFATLWEGHKGERYRGVNSNQGQFLRCLEERLFGPSASIIRVVSGRGNPVGMQQNPPSEERRAKFAVQVTKELGTTEASQFLSRLMTALRQRWATGKADREDLVGLLAVLTGRGMKRSDDSFRAAKQCLSANFDEINAFRAIAEFTRTYADEISPAELQKVKAQFLHFAAQYSSGWDNDDPDWLRQVAADLEYVGERLELDLATFTGPLYEQAEEVEQEHAGREPEPDDGTDWEHSPSSALGDDVDLMFRSLRDELHSTSRPS
jgi:hypothetical protein